MSPTDRPPLSSSAELEIEGRKGQIHTEYWSHLQGMQELTEKARADYRLLSPTKIFAPPNPRSPHGLRRILASYAFRLFEMEASYFPASPESRHWLEVLANHVILEINGRVNEVEEAGKFRFVTLDYHGLSRAEMGKAMRDGIKEPMDRLVREFEQKLYNETARHLMAVREAEKKLESQSPKRLPSTITSLSAARKVEAYIVQHGIGQTEFATRAGTTDRTLRTFRKTGKIRRSIFEEIAKAMDTTKESLLKD
jgi:hypothetical protein